MIFATVAVVVCIVGLLMYVLASNPKVAELGRIMFFCGLLVALFAMGNAGAVRIP